MADDTSGTVGGYGDDFARKMAATYGGAGGEHAAGIAPAPRRPRRPRLDR